MKLLTRYSHGQSLRRLGGSRFLLIFLLLLLLGTTGMQATDYVIAYTSGGTTYYVGMNGTNLVAKTELDATCVWEGYYGGAASLSTNTRINIRNKNNTSYYLNYGTSLTASTTNQRYWYGGDGSSIYYTRNGTTRYIHNSGTTITTNNSATDAFIPYTVTTSSVAATLTAVTISGDETLTTTGGYDYSISGTYTSGTTNYRYNGADHYSPAQTTESVTPTGTWTMSGTGTSYVSLDASTGTITVNSVPTDGDKTITLSYTPSYNGTTASAVTKTITLRAACATPTFSFDNANNQVTISTTTAGATIYYTTNGSTPTTSSMQYTGAFEQSEAAMIKAIAVKDGVADSEVGIYQVQKLTTPLAVNNAAGNAVTFTSTDEDVTFYYTYGNYDTNGDFADPTTSSTAWHTGDAAVSIPTENVVKVITAKPSTATVGYLNSDVYARRVNTTDMSERKLVIMYNAGSSSSPDVHFMANNNGSVQNTTTFDPSTCIWDGLPFAHPTAIPNAAALVGSDMMYEPFIRFRNNGRYLQLHAGPEDFNNMGWQEWVRLTSGPDDEFYFLPRYVSGQGSVISAAHVDVTQQVVSGVASFQLGYNGGKWQRYAANGLALYTNKQFAVYFPVEELGGGNYLLNVVYPANYETQKEEVNKGESVTILSSITGLDGTGTGTYGVPYYRVGNEEIYFYYYANGSAPLASVPTPSTDIRITYELLNGTDYISIDDATHTYTLVRDPGRDLVVTVRVTATPYIDGVEQPDGVQTKDYQFNILTSPPFPAPVISRVEGTNNYQMTCSASNAIIEYQIDDAAACSECGDIESTYHPGWCLYDGPITITKVGTIITARSYRVSDNMLSDPVDYKVGGAMLLPPTVTISNEGSVTLTANPGNTAIEGYTGTETFYYTTDGSDPDPENVGSVTKQYTGAFTVTNGQEVKAVATLTGFTNSAVASNTYKVASGTSSYGVVTLNDYEDHNWSYYQAAADLPSGYPDQLHSPYPRNVQITYFGYGNNNLSTTDAAAPAANTFNQNTTAADVQVGIGEEGHTFLYYKTLERDGNGRYPYELIPNPFYVRPAVTTYSGSRTLRLVMNDAGGDGWNSQLLVNFSNGRATETFQMTSGSTQTETITVNSGVTVTLTWSAGGGKNDECSFTLSYDGGDVIYDSGLDPKNGNLKAFKVEGNYTVSNYTGFYRWRIKKMEDGAIYTASTGGTALAVGDMVDAETTYYFQPSDAGETSANNATSMKVEFEALWARAEVTTGTTFSRGYNSVERNFSVGRNGTGTNVFGSSTPCTYSSFYPNGTTNGTTAATLANRNSIGIGNPSADSKVEYYIVNGNTSTMNAGGRFITIGRGVEASGTYVAQNVYGANANATNLNYRLRLESGNYQNFYLTGAGRTYSGVVSAKTILGSDYDRAKGDDSKLSIAASEGSIYGGTTLTFSGAGNRNNLTFDWNIKSGTFHSGITGNATGGTETIYLGSSQAGGGNLQYIGKRRIIVEGGTMAGIAGGMNNVSATYGVNDGTWCVMIRVKGGTMRTSIYGAAAFAQAVGDRVMILTGGTVNGWIAGGCNGTQTGSGGTMNGDSKIYVGGNTKVQHTTADPTISTSKGGNIFGAGSGYSADYEIGEVQNSNVVVADNAIVSRGVYGGGNYGYVGTGYTTNMFILGGQMANVFGGANQRFGQTVNITMTGGLVTDGLYGGSNVSGDINNNVTININGGQIGTDADHIGYVHGGGLGNATRVLGSVNMTIGESVGATKYVTVYGDVYGGSAQGRTNGNNSRNGSAVTNVTLNAGKIHGSLYGGGLGTAAYAAHVYGPVQVTVNGGGVHATNNDGSGAIYGCNNVNGAPQSTVNVDIYGTDAPADGREYALDAVYGGGNKASYNGTPVVAVHNCDNSIEYVYGGGNAADVNGTDVTIYGGNVIGTVFGGGNGTVSPANVNGNVDLDIYGGTIRQVYGGNNTSGDITGSIDINVNKQVESGHASCAMRIGELYGGGNQADSEAGTITIGCTGDYDASQVLADDNRIGYELEGIGDVYGGANKANVDGNILLTINGGIINRVFGANNNSGSINGTITIDVDKDDTQTCGWYVGDVFGGGNQAAYTHSGSYPVLNILNGTVTYDVYGGGYGDAMDKSKGRVTSNPVVNINGGTVLGGAYGGGQMAVVEGNPTVNVNNASSEVGNVYGGGRAADIEGAPTVNISAGAVTTGIYGGCNASGTVTGDIAVNITGGTVGEDGAPANVHGGGYGPETTTEGNVDVTVNGATVEIYGDVYGGSALGHVNDMESDRTTVTLTSGTIHGDFYGGGLGNAENAALVNGTVNVIVNGGTVTGRVFGANNVNGTPKGAVTVTINGTDTPVSGYALAEVYGGGNQANYEPTNVATPATVVVNNCDNSIGYVYGGGNAADVPATDVLIWGGNTIGTVFGGGHGDKTAEPPYEANVMGDVNVTIHGGTINQVFGGSNSKGTIHGDINVNIEKEGSCELHITEVYGGGNAADGKAGTLNIGCTGDDGEGIEDVYGGARQADVTGNITLNLTGGSINRAFGGNNISGSIGGNITVNVNWNDPSPCGHDYLNHVFGGGNQATYDGVPEVNIIRGTVSGNVYGGGNEAGVGGSQVTMTGGRVLSGLYGGCNTSGTVDGPVYVYVNGGTVGTDADHEANVHGGGFGSETRTTDDVTVIVGNAAGLTPVIWGDVYGGSAMGWVNGEDDSADGVKQTLVHLKKGTVNGSLYGGGLGTAEHPARVLGTVNVIVDGGTVTEAVYGANNVNGTPRGNVTVTINGTDTPAEGWALNAVYGGGNQANYTPTVTGGKATVVVNNCDNSVKDVYGGGNQASVPETDVTIHGGTFDRIFAGGNGEVAPADVTGNTSVQVLGGTIRQVFGGSNSQGSIGGTINVDVHKDGSCELHITEVYGGGNQAPSNAGNLSIGCTGGADEGIEYVYGGANDADVTGDITLTITGGRITQGVFGANNTGHTVNGNVTVNIEWDGSCDQNYLYDVFGGGNMAPYSSAGNYPAVNIKNGVVSHNVYGGGKGATAVVTGHPTVTVGDVASGHESYVATVVGDVYGGGDAAAVTGGTTVVMQKSNSTAANLFGGGNAAGVSGTTDVQFVDGRVGSGIYGGCNATGTIGGNVTVSITGGTVGTDAEHEANVHGGGYGAPTATQGDVTVTVNGAAVQVWGDVYGGSALGNVNDATSDATNVTLSAGTIHGSLYGGGLGDSDNAALVNGAVNVTVNGGTVTEAVYGANNVNGTPKGNVAVVINGTDAHVPATDSDPAVFALNAVYGGGNLADCEAPATVTVNNCTPSIKDIYGGGNAAEVVSTNVVVNGGIIDRVFAGGNGVVSAANVTGNASATIHGGTIRQVFGGSNTNGVIGGTMSVNVDKSGTCDESIDEVYGGGNLAASGPGTVTIACGAENIGDVYGGANEADIDGDIVLNIVGGQMDRVFGGNNNSGNITGSITVNINADPSSCPDFELNDVYGGGNQAAYRPTTPGSYPQVNILKGTVSHNVYGGGLGESAVVESNPEVNLAGGTVVGSVFGGGEAAPVTGHPTVNAGSGSVVNLYGGGLGESAVVTGNTTVTVSQENAKTLTLTNVFGGGEAAAVTGNTSVSLIAGTVAHLYGGGNEAGVSGNTEVNLSGTGAVTGGLYGGSNTTGTIGGNIVVTLTGGTVGVDAEHTANVHGGGYGSATAVSGDVTVNVGQLGGVTGAVIYGDVYGGSALGNVNTNTSNTTQVNLYKGTVYGNVYGGGLGDATHAALVNGNVKVVLDGVAFGISYGEDDQHNTIPVNGRVFGCNNINGTPKGLVQVVVNRTVPVGGGAHETGTYEVQAVYGGGNLAAYDPAEPSTSYSEVIVNGCDVASIEYVYGGGNAAPVPASEVQILGTFEIDYVFGGGNGKDRIFKNGVWMANPGADVGIIDQSAYTANSSTGRYGKGKAHTEILGGIIHHVFGGSNTLGNVVDSAIVTLGDQDLATCEFVVDEVFGAGNEAYMAGVAQIDMKCIPGIMSAVYGGSRLADIHNDVVLNITGGHYRRVFGGNDQAGNIYGSITVNIEETGCLPIIIGELYGGGNQADYSVYGYNDDGTPKRPGVGGVTIADSVYSHPQINVKSATRIGTVYGGGLEALVVGNPHVNINMCQGWVNGVYEPADGATGDVNDTEHYDESFKYKDATDLELGTIGTVFGGGNRADVIGDTYVNVGTQTQISLETLTTDTENPDYETLNPLHYTNPREVVGANILGNVYGGGNQANVTGKTHVTVGRESGE